jgi:nucleotide-binding universal stress UspA family protein
MVRILYATDGSRGAGLALELITGSLDSSRVDVQVLSVMPRLDVPSLVKRYREAANEAVGTAQVRLEAAGFRCRTSVAIGHPAETIVATANDEKPDLVVLGTHGLTGIERLVIGSVSGKVAAYAHVSVLVARTAGPVRGVVLGHDGSPAAERALEEFVALPFANKPSVTVCSVCDVHAPLSSGLAPTMLRAAELAYDEEVLAARSAAENAAAGAARRIREHGFEADIAIGEGRPRDALPAIAHERAADLVVVGSRGHSAIERFLLGSTSAALVGAPGTSVLIGRGAIGA